MTDPTPTLRALAREKPMDIRTLAEAVELSLEDTKAGDADRVEALLEFAKTVQALQREADAQTVKALEAERDGYRAGCQEWNEKFETWRSQLASERPRADTSDVSSGPQAETEKADQALRLLNENALLKNRIEELEAHASLVQEMEKKVEALPRGTIRVYHPLSRKDAVEVPAVALADVLALLRRSPAPVTEEP